jgi:hypothetical protein
MNLTIHAAIRSQQRGIPPLIMEWLDQFGEEYYDGHGAIIRRFSRTSWREIERQCGRDLVSKLSQYFNAYIVETHEGTVITTGHSTKRLKHK